MSPGYEVEYFPLFLRNVGASTVSKFVKNSKFEIQSQLKIIEKILNLKYLFMIDVRSS